MCSGKQSSSGVSAFAGSLVNRHHAAHVQRAFAIFVIARENFELGMQHAEFAGVAVELDLAVERDLHAFSQHVGEISPVEPLAEQRGARRIGKARFEHSEIAAFESG
jgi:hypothetical protein